MTRENNDRKKPLIRKIFISLILGIFPFLSGCDEGKSPKHNDSKVLVVGTSADNPPFETLKEGQIVGFDLDLMTLVAQKLGATLKIQDMDFNGLIPALNSGHIDVAIAGLTPSPERQKFIDFSKVYYQCSTALLVRSGEGIKGFSDLHHKKLGVQLGTTWEELAKTQAQIVPGLEIVSLNRNPQIVQELNLGRLDAVLLEETQANAFAASFPALTAYVVPEAASSFAIALRKKSPLIAEINQALDMLAQEGAIKPLEEKWGTRGL